MQIVVMIPEKKNITKQQITYRKSIVRKVPKNRKENVEMSNN